MCVCVRVCVCVCVCVRACVRAGGRAGVRACVCVSFQAYTRRRLWSDRDQIGHTHADSPRKGSGKIQICPVSPRGNLGGFGRSEIENVGNLPNG